MAIPRVDEDVPNMHSHALLVRVATWVTTMGGTGKCKPPILTNVNPTIRLLLIYPMENTRDLHRDLCAIMVTKGKFIIAGKNPYDEILYNCNDMEKIFSVKSKVQKMHIIIPSFV